MPYLKNILGIAALLSALLMSHQANPNDMFPPEAYELVQKTAQESEGCSVATPRSNAFHLMSVLLALPVAAAAVIASQLGKRKIRIVIRFRRKNRKHSVDGPRRTKSVVREITLFDGVSARTMPRKAILPYHTPKL